MKRRLLGRTGIEVSEIGLGTMTWGEQNTQDDAFEQLDLALDAGVNLLDTAEMYPVAPRAETQGETERILGAWLASRRCRARVVVASKITGPGRAFGWIRDGQTRFTAEMLVAACEGSLRRLGIDTIDLYQLHWPERSTNMFGQLGYTPRDDADATPIEETLRGLDALVRSGKIRAIGVSNETPWGVAGFLQAADREGLPRIASIQNPYSLLNRTYEIGLAEFAHREDVGLLAYSPLAMGVLSGKYAGGTLKPEGARLTRFSRFTRYQNPQAWAASEAYVQVARDAGLDPSQLALAFVTQQPFVTSNLIGATTTAQLASNLASTSINLTADLRAAIEAVHTRWPNPCP
jgi:aryl-alcohol dehydrogenase-like predicted oxidoreductase